MKNTNYLKTIFTFLIFSLFLNGCHDDIEFYEETQQQNFQLKTISLESFTKRKNVQKSLKTLSNKFDVQKSLRKNDSNSTDNSFTILTDEILEVTQDSITTYTFRIKTPTDSTSTFENFMIKQKGDLLTFIISKFKYNDNLPEDFPYEANLQYVNENQIEIENFQGYLRTQYSWVGDCLYYSDWIEYDTETQNNYGWEGFWSTPQLIGCANEPQNAIISEDDGSGGRNGGGGNWTPINHTPPNNGSNPIYGGSITPNPTPSPLVVLKPVNYESIIRNFLNTNGFDQNSSEQIWVNNHPFFATTFGQAIKTFPNNPDTAITILHYLMENDTLPYNGINFHEIFDFVNNNNNSQQTQDFATDAINELITNTTITTFNQYIENVIETPISISTTLEQYQFNTNLIGYYFNNINSEFSSLNEMLIDFVNNDNLDINDYSFAYTKIKEVYDLLKPHNLQLENLSNIDNLNTILSANDLSTLENNLVSISVFPALKEMYNEYWPQNAEEWREFGDFTLIVLKELIPELIPGVAEVTAFNNAISAFSSNEYITGSTELAFAIVGIFPVGKVLKNIAKIARGTKIVVKLTKAFRKAKKMRNLISTNYDEALVAFNQIGTAGNQGIRVLSNSTEKQGKTFFELLTKNGTDITAASAPNGLIVKLMPDGSKIQFRNFAGPNSPNTLATIEFLDGNYDNLIQKLKFNN